MGIIAIRRLGLDSYHIDNHSSFYHREGLKIQITSLNLQALGFQKVAHVPSPEMEALFLSIGHEVTFGGHYREADDL
ncbi:MAG TPA: hypothetical protein VI728_11155, partial [Syntrophales bacterium]|nr:hypothetical protein [Syntrophales bacterium]